MCHGLPEQRRRSGAVGTLVGYLGDPPALHPRRHVLPEQRRRFGAQTLGAVGTLAGYPGGPSRPTAEISRATRAAPGVQGQSGPWSGTSGTPLFRLLGCHGLPEQRRRSLGSRDPGRVPRRNPPFRLLRSHGIPEQRLSGQASPGPSPGAPSACFNCVPSSARYPGVAECQERLKPLAGPHQDLAYVRVQWCPGAPVPAPRQGG